MGYIVGAALGLALSAGAMFIGFDRDRAFYPMLTMVIASYYDLFAVLGGSAQALGLETGVMVAFIGAAVAGFRINLWIVVAALAAHGMFDFVHARLISNPGVPAWWPMFCLSYDVFAAAYLGCLLWASRISPRPAGIR